MGFFGPVQVFYDGPAPLESYYVSLARTGLGSLEAQRLGYYEAPLVSERTLPDGSTIRLTLLGGQGIAHIQVPLPQEGRKVRRFRRVPGFILCAYPTSRPVMIKIERWSAATDTQEQMAVVDVSTAYSGDAAIGGVVRGVDGATVFTVTKTGTPDDYIKVANGFIMSRIASMAASFPACRCLNTIPVCGGINVRYFTEGGEGAAGSYYYDGFYATRDLACSVDYGPIYIGET